MTDDSRKKIIIAAAIFWVLLLIFIIGFAVNRSFGKKVETEPITAASEQVSRKGITVPNLGNVLTTNQIKDLPRLLAKRTSSKMVVNKEYPALLRSGSVVRPTVAVGRTTQFILDVPGINSSYLIDRSVGEDFDILNVACVGDDQKIYNPDNCNEE